MSTPPLTPPSLPMRRAGPGFVASDRPLVRLRRALARHPYVAASVVAHLVLALGLLPRLHAADAAHARLASEAAARDARRVADTQARELQHRVERMEAIQRTLQAAADIAPAADPAASAPAGDLAARARAADAAIGAAERRLQASALARITGLSQSEAEREIDARAAAAAGHAGRSDEAAPVSAAQLIERLDRRAREALAGRELQLEAQRAGVRVTQAAEPASARASRVRAAPASAASPTAVAALAAGRAASAADATALAAATPPAAAASQRWAAWGIPRSRVQQMKAILRTGETIGRVGVDGTEAGRSINYEHVAGVAGGHVARQYDPEPDARQDGGVPVIEPGGVMDLTPHGRAMHDGVAPVAAAGSAPSLPRALRTGAGRRFGPGGAFAHRVYLDAWYVIGPFEARGEHPVDTPYPPEDDIDLDAAYPGAEGRLLTWKFASRGFYPFLPPDRADHAVYYATTDLSMDQDRDVWLDVGADDDSKMWLDGRLVWTSEPGDKPWYHPPYYFRDEQVASLTLSEGSRKVHLRRGVHRLLFKLHNASDRTFFSVVLSPAT